MSDPLNVDPTPRETVVARVRPHVRALILPTALLIAVAGAAGYLAGTFAEDWQNLTVVGVAGVLVVVGWLLPFASWLARHYTITTRRTVLREGVFVRTRQEVLHSRAVDATVRTSALQTLFGSGDVIVDVGQPRPITLRDVPAPLTVQAALHDLIELNRRPRS